MNEGTQQGWHRWAREKGLENTRLERVETFTSGLGFTIGDISVLPFTIPHDALDPVGFTFRAEGIKAAIATDLGYIPANVVYALRDCHLLMIESNHALEMLRIGPYPWAVKQRVLSRKGHLSNEALAEFFAKHYDGAATHIVLAHLSEQNNHPEIARRAAEQALFSGCTPAGSSLFLASQREVLESIRL